LTNNQVNQVSARLVEEASTVDGVVELAHGLVRRIAYESGVSHQTVSRLWKKAKKDRDDLAVAAYRATPEKSRCGRKRKYDTEELLVAIKNVPKSQRHSERALAGTLGAPKTTLRHMKRDDNIVRPRTNAIRPHLTESNKQMRLAYAADWVQLKPGADPDDDSSYESRSSYDEAHVDEKWSFLTEKDMKTHLADGEEPPERTTKDKNSVTKVMSLVAVARPRFDSNGPCTFDGKIGL